MNDKYNTKTNQGTNWPKKKRKSEGAITYLYNSQRGQWLEQMLQETWISPWFFLFGQHYLEIDFKFCQTPTLISVNNEIKALKEGNFSSPWWEIMVVKHGTTVAEPEKIWRKLSYTSSEIRMNDFADTVR